MTYSSICERALMALFRAADRKSTKTSPRPPPKSRTVVSDIRIEGCRRVRELDAGPHSKVRREGIDDEFRQQRAVALGLVHVLRGGCGDVPVWKGARASRGAARFVDRAY